MRKGQGGSEKNFKKVLDNSYTTCYTKNVKKGKVVNTMAKKPTKRELFAEIRALIPADRNDLIEFVDNEVDLLNKKNASHSNKPTERQKENADLIPVIYEGMVEGKQYTVSDLIAELPALAELNTQRVTPILGKMVKEVLVTSEKVKGRTYYTKI